MSYGHVEQIGYPEDIYERPATRFVAGFIGTSNIVESEVRGRVGDLLEVAASPNDRLLVVPPPDRAVRPGDHIAFTVRPEKLRISAPEDPVADGMCSVTGTVVDVVYQGVSTQLVVRTDDGTTLVAFRQNSERVSDAGEPGSRRPFGLGNPEYNVVLADETSLDADRHPPVHENKELIG